MFSRLSEEHREVLSCDPHVVTLSDATSHCHTGSEDFFLGRDAKCISIEGQIKVTGRWLIENELYIATGVTY